MATGLSLAVPYRTAPYHMHNLIPESIFGKRSRALLYTFHPGTLGICYVDTPPVSRFILSGKESR